MAGGCKALVLLVLLFCVACSASPDCYPGEASFVTEWNEPEPLRVCASDIADADRELSSALWDIEWTCEDYDVLVEFTDPEILGTTVTGNPVGGVSLGGHVLLPRPPPNGRWVALPFVLAHELGHELGWLHPCNNGELTDVGLPECTEAHACTIMYPFNSGMDRECILANAGLT